MNRLIELTPRLKLNATTLSLIAAHDPNDTLQEMYLACLEGTRRDFDFPKQTDAYISNFAVWRAKSYLRSERKRNHEQVSLDAVEIASNDHPVQSTGLCHADPLVGEWVRTIVQTLSEKQQRVADLLACGMSQSNIAHLLGVSRSAVSQSVRRLALEFNSISLAE